MCNYAAYGIKPCDRPPGKYITLAELILGRQLAHNERYANKHAFLYPLLREKLPNGAWDSVLTLLLFGCSLDQVLHSSHMKFLIFSLDCEKWCMSQLYLPAIIFLCFEIKMSLQVLQLSNGQVCTVLARLTEEYMFLHEITGTDATTLPIVVGGRHRDIKKIDYHLPYFAAIPSYLRGRALIWNLGPQPVGMVAICFALHTLKYAVM